MIPCFLSADKTTYYTSLREGTLEKGAKNESENALEKYIKGTVSSMESIHNDSFGVVNLESGGWRLPAAERATYAFPRGASR